MDDERITPTPENPIPDVDEIKPGIPDPAWSDEGGGGGGGGGVLKVTETDNTLSATMGEIMQAIDDCKSVYLLKTFAENSTEAIDGNDTTRQLRISAYNGSMQDGFYCYAEVPLAESAFKFDAYYAESADDYPELD